MEFVFETTVPAPRGAVFAFHADPANLEVLMRGWPGFRLLRHDGNVRPGATTWVEVTVARVLPVVMGFRHEVFEPPSRFRETQFHGPFRRFVHSHEFEDRPGGTLVRDRLDLEAAGWMGGAWATRTFAAPRVWASFAFRHAALRAIVERGGIGPAPGGGR